jgi:hypothetical protein
MNMAGYRGQLKTCAGRRERFRRVYGPLGVCQKLENFKTREKRDEFVMGATRQIPTSNSQLPTRRSYNQGEIRTIPDVGYRPSREPPVWELEFGSWVLFRPRVESLRQFRHADSECGAREPIELGLGAGEVKRAMNVCVSLLRCEVERRR